MHRINGFFKISGFSNPLVNSAIGNNGRSSDKYKSKITKIIATHHHLIGIPDIGTDKNNQC